MDVEGRLRTMVEAFRRECHRVRQSERVTVHGADSMLLVLQLAMAEVNKQVFNTHCNPQSLYLYNSDHTDVSRVQSSVATVDIIKSRRRIGLLSTGNAAAILERSSSCCDAAEQAGCSALSSLLLLKPSRARGVIVHK